MSVQCPKCGASNPTTANFCARCQTSLVAPSKGGQPHQLPHWSQTVAVGASSGSTVGIVLGLGLLVTAWLVPSDSNYRGSSHGQPPAGAILVGLTFLGALIVWPVCLALGLLFGTIVGGVRHLAGTATTVQQKRGQKPWRNQLGLWVLVCGLVMIPLGSLTTLALVASDLLVRSSLQGHFINSTVRSELLSGVSVLFVLGVGSGLGILVGAWLGILEDKRWQAFWDQQQTPAEPTPDQPQPSDVRQADQPRSGTPLWWWRALTWAWVGGFGVAPLLGALLALVSVLCLGGAHTWWERLLFIWLFALHTIPVGGVAGFLLVGFAELRWRAVCGQT